MAFRLFGIGSKKNGSGANQQQGQSPSGGGGASDNSDNDFMVVENPAAPFQPTSNPLLPPFADNPGATSSSPPREPSRRQKSQTPASYMDGVPFTLSQPSSSVNPEVNAILSRVDDYERRLNGIDWSTLDYDFSKEKAVVAQEMTDTMKKVYLGP